MDPIENRYEFVLLFDVENGNPNGDPDAGNMPRVDPESGLGIVTDVCLKRKIRNYVALTRAGQKLGHKQFDIYVREGSVLNEKHQTAYDALKIKPESKKLPKDEDKAKALTKYMCDRFFDIRTFGAVMTTEINCGQVRGPVQMNFARSIDPIVQQEITITRVAVTSTRDAEKKDREMGRKHIVPYGLYRAEGYVSAALANQRCFTAGDLALLWESLANLFEHDRSAARGKMAARKLFIFKHANKLGNAPAHKLFECIRVARKNASTPPRAFADYEVAVDRQALPKEVELIEHL